METSSSDEGRAWNELRSIVWHVCCCDSQKDNWETVVVQCASAFRGGWWVNHSMD